MADIKAGVLIKLNDKFSGGLDKASSKLSGFTNKMQGAFSKVDGALNSVAGNLATLGVSIGVGSTINKMIEFEDRITQIGAIAKSNAKDVETFEKQIEGLGNEIYRVATMPNIKVDANEMLDAIDVIMTEVGDLDYVRDNMEQIGMSIRAFGASGHDIGSMLSQFAKLGKTAEETSEILNTLYIQGNKGAFTASDFAKYGATLLSAYSKIGTTNKDIQNLGAATQIMTMGTGVNAQSVTVIKTLLSELANPQKQEKLRELGRRLNVDLRVRDAEGNFRDLNDILLKIVSTKDKLGNLDKYGEIFGMVSIQALEAYDKYKDALPAIREAQGSATAFVDAAVHNASSLKVNIANLQTAFDSFANREFAPYLEKITNYLNWFAEDPTRFDALFNKLKVGLGIFMGAKLVSGIAHTISGIKGIGSTMDKLNMSRGALSQVGGQAIPVFVTNFGTGMQGNGVGFSGSPSSPTITKKPNYVGNMAAGGAAAAMFYIPTVISDFVSLNDRDDLTDLEKNRAKGSSVGTAVGGILGGVGGAAASTAIGAAIGSVIPGVGTIIGAGVGLGISALGGWLGGKLGATIGEKLSKEETLEAVSESVKNNEKTQEPAKVEMQGNATLGIEIGFANDKAFYKATQRTNTINNLNINTGAYSELNGAY